MVIVFIVLYYYCYSIGITVTAKSPDKSGILLCCKFAIEESHTGNFIF